MPQEMCDKDFEDVLDALELFWESEVPRTGEPNAIGWASWDANGRPEARPSPFSKPLPPPSSHPDRYTRWALNEASGDRLHPLPSRSFDNPDDDDPYATILFSDVRPLLVEFRSPGV